MKLKKIVQKMSTRQRKSYAQAVVDGAPAPTVEEPKDSNLVTLLPAGKTAGETPRSEDLQESNDSMEVEVASDSTSCGPVDDHSSQCNGKNGSNDGRDGAEMDMVQDVDGMMGADKANNEGRKDLEINYNMDLIKSNIKRGDFNKSLMDFVIEHNIVRKLGHNFTFCNDCVYVISVFSLFFFFHLRKGLCHESLD